MFVTQRAPKNTQISEMTLRLHTVRTKMQNPCARRMIFVQNLSRDLPCYQYQNIETSKTNNYYYYYYYQFSNSNTTCMIEINRKNIFQWFRHYAGNKLLQCFGIAMFNDVIVSIGSCHKFTNQINDYPGFILNRVSLRMGLDDQFKPPVPTS
jgi:hypothetical protein